MGFDEILSLHSPTRYPPTLVSLTPGQPRRLSRPHDRHPARHIGPAPSRRQPKVQPKSGPRPTSLSHQVEHRHRVVSDHYPFHHLGESRRSSPPARRTVLSRLGCPRCRFHHMEQVQGCHPLHRAHLCLRQWRDWRIREWAWVHPTTSTTEWSLSPMWVDKRVAYARRYAGRLLSHRIELTRRFSFP